MGMIWVMFSYIGYFNEIVENIVVIMIDTYYIASSGLGSVITCMLFPVDI